MRFIKLFACALVLLFSSATVSALPTGPLLCQGGFAGPFPCRAVDQASHVPLTDLSDVRNDSPRIVLGWHHEGSGRDFALVVLRTRISIVEVTDEENPELIGDYRVAPPSFLGDPAIFRDHLYVPAGNQAAAKLEIFDLTRILAEPGPDAHFLADVTVDLPRVGFISINQETGIAYVVSSGFFSPGLIVALDLNDDPEAPEELFAWNPGQPVPHNLECVIYHGPDSRFSGHEICVGAAPRRSLVIYDVTDKEHPVKLSRAFYRPFNNAWHSALTADHRFALVADSHDEHNPGGNTRTFLFDLSSLTAPKHFNTYQGPTRARDLHLEVRGRHLFLANARGGLRVIDLRQTAKGLLQLREVGFFDVEPEKDSSDWFGADSVDVLPNGLVLVASLRQGLFVLRPRLQ